MSATGEGRTRASRAPSLREALALLVEHALEARDEDTIEQDAVRWSRRVAHPAEVVAVVGEVRAAAPSSPAREAVLQRVTLAAVTAVSERQLQAALTDPLTGLATRARMEQEAQHLVAVSLREHRPLTAVILDVDGLKRINDEQGHAAGDAALADVGRAIREQARRTDRAFRWGGDEFVLLMPSTTEQGARLVVERIQQAAGTPVTAGVALHHGGDDAVDIATWLSEADADLYRTRRRVRGGVPVPSRRLRRLPRWVAVSLAVAAAAVGGVAATAAAQATGLDRPLRLPVAAPATGPGTASPDVPAPVAVPHHAVRRATHVVMPVAAVPVEVAPRAVPRPVAPRTKAPAVAAPRTRQTPARLPALPTVPLAPPTPEPPAGLVQGVVDTVAGVVSHLL